jgi:hypothetical protein
MVHIRIQEYMLPVEFQWGCNMNDGVLFYIMFVVKAYRGSSGIASLILKTWH